MEVRKMGNQCLEKNVTEEIKKRNSLGIDMSKPMTVFLIIMGLIILMIVSSAIKDYPTWVEITLNNQTEKQLKHSSTPNNCSKAGAHISNDPYLITGLYRVRYDDNYNWIFNLNGRDCRVSDKKLTLIIDSGIKNPRLGFMPAGEDGITPVIFCPPDFMLISIKVKTEIFPAKEIYQETNNSTIKRVKPSEVL